MNIKTKIYTDVVPVKMAASTNQRLMSLAKESGCTKSEYVRKLIESAWELKRGNIVRD